MAITTATMQANVLKELGQNSSSTTLLARALEWLNEALDDLQMYLPEAEFLQVSEMSITAVVDQVTYAMPSDFFQLLELRNDTEANHLTMRTREEFDRLHPDPSSETSGVPNDMTLEFDRDNSRNIIRIAPPCDSTDTLYAVMRRWHPTLSGTQGTIWDKVQRPLERRAMYYGSLEVYAEQEYTTYRQELNGLSLNKFQALQQMLSIQKPKPRQIPTVLKKSDY